MTDNINVKPGEGDTVVLVKTDVIDDVHVPVYKTGYGADGDLTLVDPDNPLPIESGSADVKRHTEMMQALDDILAQGRITNLHLSIISGQIIKESDLA